jgi:hypothetical protein
VSLVLGIASFVLCPFVGAVAAIIVGWQGKKAIKAAGDAKTGRGMAVAGQILGIVNIALTLGVVALIAVGVSFARHHTSYAALSDGDCFNRAGGGLLSTFVKVVDCDKAHDAEVVGTFDAPDGNYPGVSGFQSLAGPKCESLKQSYVTTPHPGLANRFLYPSRSLWDSGTRVIVCEVRNADGSKLTGSVG